MWAVQEEDSLQTGEWTLDRKAPSYLSLQLRIALVRVGDEPAEVFLSEACSAPQSRVQENEICHYHQLRA